MSIITSIYRSDVRLQSSLLLLLLSYAAGVLAIGFGLLPSLLIVTPANLLLTFILISWNKEHSNQNYWPFVLIIFVLSFMLEILGVNTGVIFGEYEYGKVLGLKVLGTPLIIGVNWFILVLGGINIIQYLVPRWHMFWKAILVGLLLVSLDLLIEPVAMNYDFWNWNGDLVPIDNYIVWFVASAMFAWVGYYMDQAKKGWVSIFSFVCITIFFLILNIRISSSDWISISMG